MKERLFYTVNNDYKREFIDYLFYSLDLNECEIDHLLDEEYIQLEVTYLNPVDQSARVKVTDIREAYIPQLFLNIPDPFKNLHFLTGMALNIGHNRSR